MRFDLGNILKIVNRNLYYSKNRSSIYNFKVISEDKIESMINEDIYILDVRTKNEFSKMRIKGAINIPLCDINFNITTLLTDKNKKILVYCLNGERTKEAILKLNKLGYNNIYIWQGGGLINLKEGKFIEY